ncbi:GGDEF domain-containing protein [Hydrogenimonas sp.]
MDKALIKAASQECKSAIDALDIVTPSIYTALFSEIAKKYGIESGDLVEAECDSLDEQIRKLMELNEQSSTQVMRLDESSQKALKAMQESDETLLKESIDETQALRQEIERLKKSVYKDALTKTWNRKWLETDILDEEGRFKNSCTLAIVDLNYFKQINDVLGHIAGDKVLRYVSTHLKGLEVPVVRYGGDEFLLLFEADEDADTKLRKCRESLLKTALKYNDHAFKVSFSYGIHDCVKHENFSEALEGADKKMYEDKRAIKERIGPPFGE